MDLDALIALIKSRGEAAVIVSCHTDYDPQVVEINLPAGFSLTLPYQTYEQIRVAAGLEDYACN